MLKKFTIYFSKLTETLVINTQGVGKNKYLSIEMYLGLQ